MTALPKLRIAVTVFATVQAVDERDAGHIVTYALRKAINGRRQRLPVAGANTEDVQGAQR